MIGIYETLDGCQYEIFLHQPDKRKPPETKVRCIKSNTREGSFTPFTLIEGQLQRNLNANTWKKIA